MKIIQFPSSNERRVRRLRDHYQANYRWVPAALIVILATVTFLALADMFNHRYVTFFFLVWLALGSWALKKGYSLYEIRDKRLFGAYLLPPFIVFILPLFVIFRVWQIRGLHLSSKIIWLAWAWLKPVCVMPYLIDFIYIELNTKYKQNSVKAKLGRIADWLYNFSWADSTDDPGNRRHQQ